jgi:hypothetical protein
MDTIQVTFPDGSRHEVPRGTTPAELAWAGPFATFILTVKRRYVSIDFFVRSWY